MKIAKNIFDNIYNIYQIIDIDNYMYTKVLNLFKNDNIQKSLFLIKVNLEIIDIFLSDFFLIILKKK